MKQSKIVPTTLLITGAGGPGAVNMTRSLKLGPDSYFLVGCDASPFNIHLAETDAKELVPPCKQTQAYLDAVNTIVEKYKVDFIFPNNSLEGEVLSTWRERLRAKVFLPRPETYRIGASKWNSYLAWRDAGLPVPKTFLLTKPADVFRAFDEIGTFPVWVRGAGIPGKGIGVASLPCKTPSQAVEWVNFFEGWGGFIASEYLPGANLTWLGVWKDGKLIASQGRQRDAYVIPHVSPSGITGAPAVSHTVNRQDINELGEKATLAIDRNYTGPAFVDFKEDDKGVARITEINIGRFGTTHHFYSVAGANFPQLLVRVAFGLPLFSWVAKYDVLPQGLYWIRTLDAGPVLKKESELKSV